MVLDSLIDPAANYLSTFQVVILIIIQGFSICLYDMKAIKGRNSIVNVQVH